MEGEGVDVFYCDYVIMGDYVSVLGVCGFFVFVFVFFFSEPWHMEVPGLGSRSKPQL